MEKGKRRKFATEYKQDVIMMMEEKKIPINQLAKDMGLRVELLYRWRRKYGKGNPSKDNNEGTIIELKKLRKRLSEVEEERDILKKAMAIFTQPTKPDTDL